MDVYVIEFPNVHHGIMHTVFKSYEKALKILYNVKEDLNTQSEETNLFYHTPYEVDEEKGIVHRSIWYQNRRTAKEEIAAQIHKCVMDEEE